MAPFFLAFLGFLLTFAVLTRLLFFFIAVSDIAGLAVSIASYDFDRAIWVLHDVALLEHLTQNLSGLAVVLCLCIRLLQLLLQLSDASLMLKHWDFLGLFHVSCFLKHCLRTTALGACLEEMNTDSFGLSHRKRYKMS